MCHVVDVRPQDDFEAGHLPGSANLPLEELRERAHELPPAPEPLEVVDCDTSRASEAARFLSLRGHGATVILWDPICMTETGPPRVKLWQPSPFLVEALDRIGVEAPTAGPALDLACGSGRDAVYLALRGYDVEAIDVLHDALSRAEDLARRSGVILRIRVQNLEREPALPNSRYQLLVVFRYLQRSLFCALRDAIRPGGYVVYETFHELTARTGHTPRNPDHLLCSGELEQAFDGFDLIVLREAHERKGRFFSSLLARKPNT